MPKRKKPSGPDGFCADEESGELFAERAVAETAAFASAEGAGTAGTVFSRPGFIDDEFASALFGSVESGDCGVCFGGVRHLDESESSGSAGFAVDGEACACDVSVSFKDASEFIFRHCVRHVSDVNLHFSLFRVMDPVCPSGYSSFAFLCCVFTTAWRQEEHDCLSGWRKTAGLALFSFE